MNAPFSCRPKKLLSFFDEITHAVYDLLNHHLAAGLKTAKSFE